MKIPPKKVLKILRKLDIKIGLRGILLCCSKHGALGYNNHYKMQNYCPKIVQPVNFVMIIVTKCTMFRVKQSYNTQANLLILLS